MKMRTEALGGGGGDGTYFIWLVAWYQKALFQLHISPFFAPGPELPQGWNLATTDITPAMVALALPGSLLVSPTFGYNFAIAAKLYPIPVGPCIYGSVILRVIRWPAWCRNGLCLHPFPHGTFRDRAPEPGGHTMVPILFLGLFDLLKTGKICLEANPDGRYRRRD